MKMQSKIVATSAAHAQVSVPAAGTPVTQRVRRTKWLAVDASASGTE